MIENESDKFDDWFAETFPKYVYGKRFIEPYYSIAQIAYDKGWGDGTADAVNRLARRNKGNNSGGGVMMGYDDVLIDNERLEKENERLKKENVELKKRVKILEKDIDLYNKRIDKYKNELKKTRCAYITACVRSYASNIKSCDTCRHNPAKFTADVLGEKCVEPCCDCNGFDKWEEI